MAIAASCWFLSGFWNADKHRFLLPSYTTIDPLQGLTAGYVGNCDAGGTLGIQMGSGEMTERGAELAVVQLGPTGPNPQVEMKGDPPIAVAFSGGQGIVESLEEIGVFIRTCVLSPLQELFP